MTLENGTRPAPLFVLPGLGGDALELKRLAERLPARFTVHALRAQGHAPGEEPHTSVDAMADAQAKTLLALQPFGPFALLGYSFGGLVAVEVARRLEEVGRQVCLLGLLDTVLDESCLPLTAQLTFRALRAVHHRVPRFGGLATPVCRAIERRLGATLEGPPVSPWERHEPSPAKKRVMAASWVALRAYRPQPIAQRLTYFRARERSIHHADPLELWRALSAGQLTVVHVAGDHVSMICEPHVASLANHVAAQLDAADDGIDAQVARTWRRWA